MRYLILFVLLTFLFESSAFAQETQANSHITPYKFSHKRCFENIQAASRSCYSKCNFSFMSDPRFDMKKCMSDCLSKPCAEYSKCSNGELQCYDENDKPFLGNNSIASKF